MTDHEITGNLKSLNELAKQARADYIIHTGDFGFYDESSLDRIAEKYVTRSREPDSRGRCFSSFLVREY